MEGTTGGVLQWGQLDGHLFITEPAAAPGAVGVEGDGEGLLGAAEDFQAESAVMGADVPEDFAARGSLADAAIGQEAHGPAVVADAVIFPLATKTRPSPFGNRAGGVSHNRFLALHRTKRVSRE